MNNRNLKNSSYRFTIPKTWIFTSVLTVILVTVTSLLGILYDKTYARETVNWAIQAVGQDYANLVVVVLLLISVYYTAKGSLRAYLLWLGALSYLIYAFVIYAFAVHFQFLFLAYAAVLGLSTYTLIGGLMAVDREKAAEAVTNVKTKGASIFLIVVGILFILLWLSEIVPNLFAGTIPQNLKDTGLWVNPVHVLDLSFFLPAMIITAIMLWKKKSLGYILAVPLMVFTITMGLGIVIMFLLSALKDMPYSLPAGILIGVIMIVGSILTINFIKKIDS